VIAANKSDLKGALNLEEVRKKMNLSKEIPIVQVVAENLKDVRRDKPCRLNEVDVHNVLSKLFEVVV
jgi:signal recognition particle receptor subunit beta